MPLLLRRPGCAAGRPACSDVICARLARYLVADQLLLLSDVAAVMRDFGTGGEPDTRGGAAQPTDPVARPHPRTPQEAA